MNTTRISQDKTNEEMVYELQLLATKLNRIPIQSDLKNSNIASCSAYYDRFGGFNKALKLAGFSDKELKYKTYVTKNGTTCLSVYEYRFTCLLETRFIEFKKESLYKDYIKDFDKNYRFDFIIHYENKEYFIEIFGITGSESYDIRAEEKIKICDENNIPLIALYPDLFWNSTQQELFDILMQEINKVNAEYDKYKIAL